MQKKQNVKRGKQLIRKKRFFASVSALRAFVEVNFFFISDCYVNVFAI